MPRRRSPRAAAALAAFLLVLAVGAGGCRTDEREAERALDRALSDTARPPADVQLELERIVETWPGTEAARRARQELESADTIDRALARGLSLRAWDAVKAVARAVEQYKARHGRLPARLRSLVPRYLQDVPSDPWGRPIVYTREGDGYLVVSYGADGIPGGAGAGRDYVVESGRVRRD